MYSDDGKTYGMATIGNCQRFIYNQAHLESVELSAPETWEGLLAAAQKVVDPSKNRYGFVAGTERLIKAFSVWLPIYWANGGQLFDQKMQPIFGDATGLDALNLLNTKANQITYAYGSLVKTDSLYNLCYPVQTAPAAVCRNGVMDYVLHPIEPLAVRLTLVGAF